jgi:hypothetical protein
MNKGKNLLLFTVLLTGAWMFAGCKPHRKVVRKPVIYLYPEKQQQVSVQLQFNGQLRATYPLYQDQWSFMADTDGSLTDTKNGEKYQYLFYDGLSNVEYAPFTSGFAVKTDTVVQFLQHQLKYLGLKDREYHDMISYWLPDLNEKPYTLIRFRPNKNCDEMAKLNIQPQPETEIRVMMEFMPMDTYTALPAQHLPKGIRKGFTVVEWGGIRLDETLVQ